MANLMPGIEGWIEKALSEAVPGEEVDYTANFSLVGSPDGQAMTVLIVLLHLRALAVGEWITHALWVTSARPDEEGLTQAIKEGIGKMLAERSKLAREALAEGNGHGHGHDIASRLRGAIDLKGGLPPV